MRLSVYCLVATVSACVADSESDPVPATETAVSFGAGPAYAGALVTLDGATQTLDEHGSAYWIVTPPIVSERLPLTVALAGATEEHFLEAGLWRRDVHVFGEAPYDSLETVFGRNVETNACGLHVIGSRVGRTTVAASLGGVDRLLCGSFAPTCTDVRDEVAAFVDAAKACGLDDECVALAAPCWPTEPCCRVYVNTSVDRDRWDRLMTYGRTCGTQVPEFGGCACSCSAAPPARCVEGRCTAAPP